MKAHAGGRSPEIRTGIRCSSTGTWRKRAPGSQTRKLDTTLSTATYDKAGTKLYVLDAAGVAKDMRMHQVDRATGEILGTVAPCAWRDPLVSVAALEQSTPRRAPCGGHVLGFFLLSPQPHGGRF
ncbi:MAG: hypothetical protein ACLU9S_05595 [Oscillospiraceae bacterium]